MSAAIAVRATTMALLAALVAGCAFSDQQIYNRLTYRTYPQSYLFGSGSDSRAVPTHISGNPFGIAPATLANVVAAALQSAFPTSDVIFATRRGSGLRHDVDMVVAFDPPDNASPQWLCQMLGRTPSRPLGTSVHTMMTFCWAGTPLVSIEGRFDRAGGAGDQAFVTLLRDMLRRMFDTSTRVAS